VITLAKLITYRKFRGDSDMWGRTAKAQDPDEITWPEWSSIDEILQRLHIVQSGMAAPEFAEETFTKLCNMANDDAVRVQLSELAMQPGMK
jgi:hypothetical protein